MIANVRAETSLGHFSPCSQAPVGAMAQACRGLSFRCCCSVAELCLSLQPHGLQHARPPHPSPSLKSLLKLMPVESVMPSHHLILCHPFLLLPSIFPSIRVFSSELTLCVKWPKYWSFSFSISHSNEYSGLISLGWTDLISLQSKGLSRVFSNTTVQKHQFYGTHPSL